MSPVILAQAPEKRKLQLLDGNRENEGGAVLNVSSGVTWEM